MGPVPDTDQDGVRLTVFRSRLLATGQGEYAPLAAEMEQLARAMPGFVEIKTFRADDGERVSLVTFADQASHDAWRDHPEHRRAQARRADLYQEYSVQVCRVIRSRSFRRQA